MELKVARTSKVYNVLNSKNKKIFDKHKQKLEPDWYELIDNIIDNRLTYDSLVVEARENNKREALIKLKSGKLLKEDKIRLNNYEKKWNFPPGTILNDIKNEAISPISILAVEPKKQNIGEKYTAAKLEEIKRFTQGRFDWCKLSSKCLWLFNGRIHKTSEIKKLKSIDFLIYDHLKRGLYLIFQKRISESGGAQKNQYNDVITSLEHSSTNAYGIIAICDGDYFTDKRIKELSSINKRATITKSDLINRVFVDK